jgi:hypothetical protein
MKIGQYLHVQLLPRGVADAALAGSKGAFRAAKHDDRLLVYLKK